MDSNEGAQGQGAGRPKRRGISTPKLLLILGGLALSGLLFWGGMTAAWVHFYGRDLVDDTRAGMDEGTAKGRQLDAGGCVDTALERVKSCAGYNLKCRLNQQFFLQGVSPHQPRNR